MNEKDIVIIVSRFNETVTTGLLNGAKSVCHKKDIMPRIIEVPGAVEIPLIAKKIAKQGNVSAIVCLGAVIYGQTDHYHYVCKQVSDGCQQVMLEYEIPVIFGVLTTQTEALAIARSSNDANNKGMEAMTTALEMIRLLETV